MTCACATFVNKCHAIDTPTPLHRHYEVKRQHFFSLGMKRTSLLATRVCPFTGLDVWNTGLDYWTSGILDWTTGLTLTTTDCSTKALQSPIVPARREEADFSLK